MWDKKENVCSLTSWTFADPANWCVLLRLELYHFGKVDASTHTRFIYLKMAIVHEDKILSNPVFACFLDIQEN